MTLKPMYPAIINSPGTELAADITATATEITVLSSNGLPPAPNLLTLGSDETAETVRYTKVEETKLTVERGFQGVAKSWSAGTRVARYFTAYDHDTFRENIEAIDAETSDAEHADLTLNVGLQIVESAQDTPFQFDGVRGSTRINLNGKDGNFDYRTSPLFTFFGTSEIVPSNGPVGTKCQRVVCNRTDTAHFGSRYELEIDRSKHYIAMAYIENVSCDIPVYFSIAEFKDTGYISIQKSASLDKGSGMQYLYTTINPTQMENREKLIYYFRGEGTSGAEFRIGPFAFYEITEAEYDAIAKMTPEQVAERYPYVDSMTNVTNPYAIVTGGNLLPPFTEWGTSMNSATYYIANQYEVTIHSTDADTSSLFYSDISVIENTDYSLSCDHNAWIGVYRTDGSTAISPYTQDSTIHFNSGNEQAIRLYFSKRSLPVGSYTFKNPMLTIGTEPKPFTPQQRSMIAFETELAAHPVDGSNPDTLFMGDDGLPYVLEPWGKVTLDGNMKYLLAHNGGDFRTFFTETLPPTVKDTAYVTKYDGKMLARRLLGQSITEGDTQVLTDSTDVNPNRSVFSVFNTDSGWGPDYKLTEDDIKAYFLGWKMFDNSTNGDGTGVYNRTDGQHKAWTPLDSFDGNRYYGVYNGADVPKELPNGTNTNVYAKKRSWQPYRLQYLKAKPTVEPVRNYELGATLSAGSNMVEVGSGIVIREKANPVYGGAGYYYINTLSSIGNPFKHRTNKINMIYAGHNEAKSKWIVDGVDAYGNERAKCLPENFDPTAAYHVTYTMLDPTLSASISGTVASNLRGTVSDLVQDVGDVQRRLSVVETQKADAVEDTGWIPVTPLNGWVQYSANPCRFRLRGKTLKFVGILSQGTAAAGTTLFQIPVTLNGPNVVYRLQVPSWSSGESKSVLLTIDSAGKMMISNAPSSYFIGFDGFELEADWVVKKS